jgi:protein MBA1
MVVRITSRQSTTKSRTQRDGAEVLPISSKEQDCIEYVVIQHLRWNNQDKGWRVWGTTNPTTLHAAQTDPYFMSGLSALERMEMIKDSMGKK